jgi:intracellular sulfur oxidation DsrE/DsrF family protein
MLLLILKHTAMKIFMFLLVMYVFHPFLLQAQNSNYKVVFDLSSKDTVNHASVIRELTLIRDANPDAMLEVVVYGKGVDLVLKDKTSYDQSVQKLIEDKAVSFKVCAMTLSRNHIDKSQLVPGVEVVPDGIYEIISKQQQGWGYIKVAH